ncbi:MAG: NAD(P)-dependent alcohol dehydrogenase [Gaiellaceae bacterium]
MRKPERLSFEQAAAIPVAGITALQGLRDKGGIQAGQRVLVNGAAGGIGTFAVQIAKALGAHVTGVCSTRNVELVRSLGADEVVDYTQDDFTRKGPYDLVLDNVGNRSLAARRRALAPAGRWVVAGGLGGNMTLSLLRSIGGTLLSRLGRKTMTFFIASIKQDDLLFLAQLAEEGKLTPVVDRTYPLADVPDAVRYLETEHARGKVVIAV